jgi:hypothetical protein
MRADLALANDRAGKDRPHRAFSRDGKGFTCQRGLIHFHFGSPVQQSRIRRHDIAQAQADHVARHKFTRCGD